MVCESNNVGIGYNVGVYDFNLVFDVIDDMVFFYGLVWYCIVFCGVVRS